MQGIYSKAQRQNIIFTVIITIIIIPLETTEASDYKSFDTF